MENRGATIRPIDEVLAGLAAGTITDADVVSAYGPYWAGYELKRGGPVAERDAYWRILALIPEAPKPARTAKMEQIDADAWRDEQAQRRNDEF